MRMVRKSERGAAADDHQGGSVHGSGCACIHCSRKVGAGDKDGSQYIQEYARRCRKSHHETGRKDRSNDRRRGSRRSISDSVCCKHSSDRSAGNSTGDTDSSDGGINDGNQSIHSGIIKQSDHMGGFSSCRTCCRICRFI